MNPNITLQNIGARGASGWREFFRRLPLVRSFNQNSPPYHIGSIVENRLGLQVARTIGKSIARGWRGKFTSAGIENYARVLERDGVLVIENFLADEEFRAVCAEFEKANEGIPLAPYKNAENAKLYRAQLDVTGEAAQRFPAIEKTFQENDLLKRIAEFVVRRPLTQKPDIMLDTYQNLNDAGVDNDIENILHADLHIPTVKMFFYLNEVNEKNGAFIYAKGSHKLTFARLAHEYEMSVREAKLKCGKAIPESLTDRRAAQIRNIIAPANRRKMKIVETQIRVKPNTLVVANNMGFHRRGEFRAGSEPRKALLVNYRKAERLFL